MRAVFRLSLLSLVAGSLALLGCGSTIPPLLEEPSTTDTSSTTGTYSPSIASLEPVPLAPGCFSPRYVDGGVAELTVCYLKEHVERAAMVVGIFRDDLIVGAHAGSRIEILREFGIATSRNMSGFLVMSWESDADIRITTSAGVEYSCFIAGGQSPPFKFDCLPN